MHAVASAITEPATTSGLPTWVVILLAVIAIVPATIGAWLAYDSRRNTQAISVAVNHVAEGEPPLIERVRRIERVSSARHEWHVGALHVLFDQIGVDMPHPPDESMEVKP